MTRIFEGVTVYNLRRGLLVLFVAFLSGIICASVMSISLAWWWLGILLGFGFLIITCIRRSALITIVALVFFGVSLGGVRFSALYPEPIPTLELYVGETVTFEGLLADDPDEREKNIRLLVRIPGRDDYILGVVPLGTQVGYGYILRLTGVLERPSNFQTDTGREFDYIQYLRVRRVQYLVNEAHVEVVSPGRWWSPGRLLFGLKAKFLAIVQRDIPEPAVSLGVGLVLGVKQGLGEMWSDVFRRAGLTHIIVLSGYNLTVVAEGTLALLGWWFARGGALTISGVSIVLFAMMVGGGATVVRATIMALLALIARGFGRTYRIGFALIGAAVVMVWHNPLILVFDVGFQLSFLATIGLVYGVPLVEPYFQWVPERFGARDIVSSTVATQCFVLPWILYSIGQLSIVSLLTNLLVLPLVPLTMFVVFLTGVSGMAGSIVSFPFATISFVLLTYIMTIARTFASLPWASVVVPVLPIGLVVLWYGGYWCLWWYSSHRSLSTGSSE